MGDYYDDVPYPTIPKEGVVNLRSLKHEGSVHLQGFHSYIECTCGRIIRFNHSYDDKHSKTFAWLNHRLEVIEAMIGTKFSLNK